MPLLLLLLRYVLDNMGTLLVHRLANMESYKAVKDALGGIPVSQLDYEISYPVAINCLKIWQYFGGMSTPA
jgi:hypothetical protein